MKPLLGGKGANLAEMTRIGLPVPPGFTITTEVCTYYYDNKQTYPKALDAQVEDGVAYIEKIMGTKFGDKTAMPLLVSVRSGARDSMPGMMDTILNLGLNDQTVLALGQGDEERALRLGLLPPLRPDVRRRRHGRAEARRTKITSRSKSSSTASSTSVITRTSKTPSSPSTTCKELVDAFQGADQGAHRQGISAGSRGSSSGAPSAPCSAPG